MDLEGVMLLLTLVSISLINVDYVTGPIEIGRIEDQSSISIWKGTNYG